ncbi:MAG: ACP S-malonyltransferase [Hyphomicrobiaceae bacterium]
MAIAFTFPGQGSQSVGMGKALAETFPAAKAVFDEVDAALGQKLTDIMWTGPQETLTLTENAQPALMAVSMAVMRSLEAAGLDLPRHVAAVAGHSLGEYSALAAAGTFSLADTARLLKTRGQAMQKAVPVGAGAMAALLGIGREAAEKVAAEASTSAENCQVANDNDPAQVVISGAKEAVIRATEIAKAHGCRRAVMLDVSAPFHSALMQPAADIMADALGKVAMAAPKVPLYANVGAAPLTDPDAIRRSLVAQVTGTVRWRESIAAMAAAGITDVYEIGAGRVLTGLVRRIVPSLQGKSVGTPGEVGEAVAAITGAAKA